MRAVFGAPSFCAVHYRTPFSVLPCLCAPLCVNVRSSSVVYLLDCALRYLNWPLPSVINLLQFTGTVKVDEFASASDEDDYLFEFLVDGAAADNKEAVRVGHQVPLSDLLKCCQLAKSKVRF
jgi:hypothetical protein